MDVDRSIVDLQGPEARAPELRDGTRGTFIPVATVAVPAEGGRVEATIGGHGLLLRTKDATAPLKAPVGAAPVGVCLQLDGAFRAFAALVNALPNNASTQLSVIRSHADATANRWGYTWQLGHPVEPAHLWFLTETTGAIP